MRRPTRAKLRRKRLRRRAMLRLLMNAYADQWASSQTAWVFERVTRHRVEAREVWREYRREAVEALRPWFRQRDIEARARVMGRLADAIERDLEGRRG